MVFASDSLNGRNAVVNTGKSGFLELLALKLRQRHDVRKTRNELSSLCDRSLADLGLTRSQIDVVARQAVYGMHV